MERVREGREETGYGWREEGIGGKGGEEVRRRTQPSTLDKLCGIKKQNKVFSSNRDREFDEAVDSLAINIH